MGDLCVVYPGMKREFADSVLLGRFGRTSVVELGSGTYGYRKFGPCVTLFLEGALRGGVPDFKVRGFATRGAVDANSGGRRRSEMLFA